MKKHLSSLIKSLLAVVLLGIFATGSLPATPILFNSASLTGTVSNHRILVSADQTPYPPVSGTNLLTGLQFYLQPVLGQVITNLVPWGYTIQVEGWPRSIHIVVPDDTNTLNVVTLINTNAFAPLNLYSGGITIIDGGGSATNAVTYSFFNTNLTAGITVTNIVDATHVSVGTGTNLTAYATITALNSSSNSLLTSITNQGTASTNDTIARIAALNLGSASTVSSNTFLRSGSGGMLDAGLQTNLNASQLATGTIPYPRLPPAVVTNGTSATIDLYGPLNFHDYVRLSGETHFDGDTSISGVLYDSTGFTGIPGEVLTPDVIGNILWKQSTSLTVVASGSFTSPNFIFQAGITHTFWSTNAPFPSTLVGTPGNSTSAHTVQTVTNSNASTITETFPITIYDKVGQTNCTQMLIPGHTTVSLDLTYDPVTGNYYGAFTGPLSYDLSGGTNYASTNLVADLYTNAAVPAVITFGKAGGGIGKWLYCSTNANFTISSFAPLIGVPSSAYMCVSNSSGSMITGTVTAFYSPINISTTNALNIGPHKLGFFYADSFSGGNFPTNLADSSP